MFEVKNLKVSFSEKNILRGVSFSVEKGEVFGVLGKNGAGKTTLFNSICGMVKYEGSYCLNQKDVKSNDISYLKTSTYFYPYMKASEYFDFFENNKTLAINLATVFEIPLNDYIDNFSTGMKKKTAMIANVSLNRPLLILDEPFNGLDLESVEKLYLLVQKLKDDGVIILLSSHILETLKMCCDKIGHLENGIIKDLYLKNNFGKLENNLRTSIKDSWSQSIKNA